MIICIGQIEEKVVIFSYNYYNQRKYTKIIKIGRKVDKAIVAQYFSLLSNFLFSYAHKI